MKSLCVAVGMPGSGKGSFSHIAEQFGFHIYICGDVIREEAIRQGKQLTREILSTIMVEIRKKEGPAIVVERLMDKIDKNIQLILIEGVRSLDEIQALRKKFNTIIFAIHASPSIRFKRLKERGRTDDPKTFSEFQRRDQGELMMVLHSGSIHLLHPCSLMRHYSRPEECMLIRF